MKHVHVYFNFMIFMIFMIFMMFIFMFWYNLYFFFLNDIRKYYDKSEGEMHTCMSSGNKFLRISLGCYIYIKNTSNTNTNTNTNYKLSLYHIPLSKREEKE